MGKGKMCVGEEGRFINRGRAKRSSCAGSALSLTCVRLRAHEPRLRPSSWDTLVPGYPKSILVDCFDGVRVQVAARGNSTLMGYPNLDAKVVNSIGAFHLSLGLEDESRDDPNQTADVA